MSSYYPSFSYKGLNSLNDKNLIVVAFDADEGEKDTFLGMDPIYTEKYDGSRRYDYGAKFNSVAVVKISVIKANRRDFTVAEVRDFLKWTTGSRQNSYLDLLIEDRIRFSFLGRVTSAYQQKLDARTIGLSIEFTSVSPWAYSPQQFIKCSFGQKLTIVNDGVVSKGESETLLNVDNNGVLYNGTGGGAGLFQITNDGVVYIDNSVLLQINNLSDDLYSYVNLDIRFINENSDHLVIKNQTLYDESDGTDGLTEIKGMVDNEIINLSAEQFIISDYPGKIFGEDFNFIWPKLLPGINQFIISGSGQGEIEFTYRYPIKIGDCAIDINTSNSNYGCIDDSSYGVISWSDIVDTPSTLAEYGIKDAYTITEVDKKIAEIECTGGGGGSTDIDKDELDDMLGDIFGS